MRCTLFSALDGGVPNHLLLKGVMIGRQAAKMPPTQTSQLMKGSEECFEKPPDVNKWVCGGRQRVC